MFMLTIELHLLLADGFEIHQRNMNIIKELNSSFHFKVLRVNKLSFSHSVS